MLFFLSFAFFLNRWYFHSRSKKPEVVINSTKNSTTDSDLKEEKPSHQKKDINLTFYERLSRKKSSYSKKSSIPSPSSKSEPSSLPLKQKKSKDFSSDSNADSFNSEKFVQENLRYTVQVGSFQSLKRAEGMLKSLKQEGFSPSITPINLSRGETWYRVRIGIFLHREEAEKVAQKLQEKGNLHPLIMSLKKTDG